MNVTENKEQADYLRLARDRMARVMKTGQTAVLPFADPALMQMVERLRRAEFPDCFISWDGGVPGAERCAAFLSDWETDQIDAGIAAVSFAWDARYGTPEHRDILGALIGLGFSRDRLGDIILEEQKGWCVTTKETAAYLCTQWESAGRVTLKNVSLADPSGIPVHEEEVTVIRDTVASLRLDAVLSSAYRTSRTTCAQWIRSEKVKLNFLPCVKPDAPVSEGDLLSVRGMGRAKLAGVGSRSQKGRIWIEIHRTAGKGLKHR